MRLTILALVSLAVATTAFADCPNFAGHFILTLEVLPGGQTENMQDSFIDIQQTGCTQLTINSKRDNDTESVTFTPDGTPAQVTTNSPDSPAAIYGSFKFNGNTLMGDYPSIALNREYELNSDGNLVLTEKSSDGGDIQTYVLYSTRQPNP